MWARFRTWFNALPLIDAVQHRQSLSLQIIQFSLICAVIPAAGLILISNQASQSRLILAIRLLALMVVLISSTIGIWLLRRGLFQASVLSSVGGLQAALALFLILSGVLRSGSVMLAMTIPIVLIGLLLGRRILLIFAAASSAIISTIAYLETIPGTFVARYQTEQVTSLSISVTFILCIGLIVLAIDRFSSAMRDILNESAYRQRELEGLRTSLEQTVVERTASLADALRSVEQREAVLSQALTDLQESQTLVRELSSPVIPVLAGVLVVPLVGSIDETRATGVSQHILEQVEHQRAHTVIIDVTGVPLIDTHVAQTLLRTAAAIRLLGAQAFLVGVRPEVAQTIVSLGADLSAIPTFASLQEAVEELMAATNTHSSGSAYTVPFSNVSNPSLLAFSRANS